MVFAPELLVFNQLEELRKEAASQRRARAVVLARRQARHAARVQARSYRRRAADVMCSYAAAHAGGQA